MTSAIEDNSGRGVYGVGRVMMQGSETWMGVQKKGKRRRGGRGGEVEEKVLKS